ncbi:MAG: hydrogenase maturation protease [Archaeoglobales archaeon]|nr:hydrogenase maturation protease [Archaeoglobales archaeon]
MISILFLGNSIYSDDKIALIVGEKLKDRLEADGFEVKFFERSGYALIDQFLDKEIVLIVDSVLGEVGKVFLIEKVEEITKLQNFSHYAGISGAVQFIRALNPFQPKIFIVGIGVKNPYTVSESISQELEMKIEKIADDIYNIIRDIFKAKLTK